MKLCRKCNVNYDDPERNFCSKCGSTLVEVNVCPNCHTENSLDFAFCKKCGTKLNSNGAEETIPVQTTPQENVANSKDNKNGNTKVINSLIKCFAVMVVIAVAGYYFSTKHNDIKPVQNQKSEVEIQNLKNEIRDLKWGKIIDFIDYSKPELSGFDNLVKDKVYYTKTRACEHIIRNAKFSAFEAARLLTNKSQFVCPVECLSNYKSPGVKYTTVTKFVLPETLTYPQKFLMDFWYIVVVNEFINDEVQDSKYPTMLYHTQLSKDTYEGRIIEKRAYMFKDNKFGLYSSKDMPDLKVTDEEMKFKKKFNNLEEIKSERLRLFYIMF